MALNWFVECLIKLYNYNCKFHWHKQVWERGQLPLGKHSAQLVGAEWRGFWTATLLSHVPPAVGIGQRERRELASLAGWLTAV